MRRNHCSGPIKTTPLFLCSGSGVFEETISASCSYYFKLYGGVVLRWIAAVLTRVDQASRRYIHSSCNHGEGELRNDERRGGPHGIAHAFTGIMLRQQRKGHWAALPCVCVCVYKYYTNTTLHVRPCVPSCAPVVLGRSSHVLTGYLSRRHILWSNAQPRERSKGQVISTT